MPGLAACLKRLIAWPGAGAAPPKPEGKGGARKGALKKGVKKAVSKKAAPKKAAPKKAVPEAPEPGALRQVAALPLRRGADGGIEVLLVTSRETRRWVAPKGWPMKGRKDHAAAALEAKQEAGVVGRVGKAPLGSYLYWKRRPKRFDLTTVDVYRLDVERQLTRWKERGQREARWFPAAAAALAVEEAGLAALIEGLAGEILTSIDKDGE